MIFPGFSSVRTVIILAERSYIFLRVRSIDYGRKFFFLVRHEIETPNHNEHIFMKLAPKILKLAKLINEIGPRTITSIVRPMSVS